MNAIATTPRTEIAVVGAGPAGLGAALYAARFCRRTLVFHDDAARAARIPLTMNVPGFDSGINGADLLARMTRHAEKFGAAIVPARIRAVEPVEDGFVLTSTQGQQWHARAVILATGVTLNQIPLGDDVHEAALRFGVLRYCPICDGYEHRGQRIAVVGFDSSGAAEAVFLRRFSDDLTLLPRRDVDLTQQERARLKAAGIATVPTPIARYVPTPEAMLIYPEGAQTPLRFDILFPGLGVRPRNELALSLGLAVDDVGNVAEDAPFGTERPGVYCAGDVVKGLDQISVAMGHGAIAATRAHNWLSAQDGATADAILG